ncbi:PilZ domain-containing protein [Sphingomonas sp. M1-B02]|uniref:PilZ domain-containing protein n=1 Tax=Sphingomonas sp. M1-B02 TaxID=3114300 RepID=UPI00223ECA42|nr:PilZ domain-containing protein [Sphingomonas sp. S6-11]UZK67743.1 PilZ domain-containing protein [Sphingomonas sp. S6-11]
MGIAAQLFIDARSGERTEVALDGTLRSSDGIPIDIEIDEISLSGFRTSTPLALRVGDSISVGISGLGMRRATVVRQRGDSFGCRFTPSLPSNFLDGITASSGAGAMSTIFPERLGSNHTADQADARFPFRTRMIIIVGASLLLWSALLAAMLSLSA